MGKLEFAPNLVDSVMKTATTAPKKFESNGTKILKLLFHGSSLQAGTPYGAGQVGFPEEVTIPGQRQGATAQAGATPVCDFLSFCGEQFEITDAGRTFQKNGMFAWEFTKNKLTRNNIQNYFSNKISGYIDIIESESLGNGRDKFSSIDSLKAAGGFQVQLKNGGATTKVIYDDNVAPPNFCPPNRALELEWNLLFVISSQMNLDTIAKLTDFTNYMIGNPPQNWAVTPITHSIPGQNQAVNVPGAIQLERVDLPTLRVGFITSNSFIDLAAEVEEICHPTKGIGNGAKRLQFLSRCIGTMTSDAFDAQNARFIHSVHNQVMQLAQANQDFSSVRNLGAVTFSNNATATKYSITGLYQKLLAQMSIVPRTLRNPEALQRPPNWKHLTGMSESIQSGKSFALPVIAITDGSVQIDELNQLINPTLGNFIIPHNWEIVDGQHRVYSYFALPAAQPQISLDLSLFIFDQQVAIQARREAAAELFFDINHRSLEPDKVHAIAHYSKFDNFETGWRFRTGVGEVNGDKATWSSRLLAGRFILELNSTPNSPFLGLFDVHGIDRNKIPLSSVTQYLSCFFDFGRKWKFQNQVWTNSLIGSYSIYSAFQIQDNNGNDIFPADLTWRNMTAGLHDYRGPSPKSNDLEHFWPELISQFQLFLERTGLNNQQITDLFSNTSEKSARLPAIFSLFAWYYCSSPGGNVNNPAAFSNRSLDPQVNPQVAALTHLGNAMQDPQTWANLPTGRAAVLTIAGKLYNYYCESCTNAGIQFARFGPSPHGIFAQGGQPAQNDDYKNVKWYIGAK